MSPSPNAAAKRASFKMFVKRQVRTIHWMSGAVCLVGMILFASTGITLNHAGILSAKPKVIDGEVLLPEEMTLQLQETVEDGTSLPLPKDVARHLKSETGFDLVGRSGEWTEYDINISLARPGGDAWVSIDRETGDVLFEKTNRGVIAYLNDLHKGRNTGLAWTLFLDLFAIGVIVFSATGLWLLQMQSARRNSTWPLTAAGFALPVILLLIFVHG